MTDVLYDSAAQVLDKLRTTFPEAKLSVEYSDFRGETVGVDLPSIDEEAWFRFLLREKLAGVSLAFQILLQCETPRAVALMDEVHPGWRKRRRAQ